MADIKPLPKSPITPGDVPNWLWNLLLEIVNRINQLITKANTPVSTGPAAPAAHATTHATGGTDALAVADIGAAPAAAGVPSGAVMAFAMNAAPTGWLKCDGAAVSRTTYADLFTAIGTAFGAGDGSTTFGLPDLRGEFVRGWDDARGVDAGRTVGSAQADALQGHNHYIYRLSAAATGYTLNGLTSGIWTTNNVDALKRVSGAKTQVSALSRQE